MVDTRENSATVMPGLRLSWGGLHPDGRVPVLLVPGYGDSWRFWLPIFPYLPDSLRVFALSPRGHGTSDAPATGYTVADNADDLARFLDAVHITKAIVVGHSSGGYVARQFAVDHPDRVQALVLVGSPLSLHGRRAPFSALVESMQDPVDPATVRAFAAGFAHYADVDPAVQDAVINDALRMPARAWQQTLAGLTEAGAPPPNRIYAPTLVAWGADDELLDAAEPRVLAESIPGARQREYPAAGHLVAWDVPAALASDLVEFSMASGGS
ncbi:alpha/beta hydrolase [Specibacter sp. NPDC078692]|uniref:alpha/beta fold hydrolase n=1 Tax=Specibacter sp. NPDC078692 TaxID=3155818 RepID=UPI0034416A46